MERESVCERVECKSEVQGTTTTGRKEEDRCNSALTGCRVVACPKRLARAGWHNNAWRPQAPRLPRRHPANRRLQRSPTPGNAPKQNINTQLKTHNTQQKFLKNARQYLKHVCRRLLEHHGLPLTRFRQPGWPLSSLSACLVSSASVHQRTLYTRGYVQCISLRKGPLYSVQQV
jgi:hypothetical protein